MEPTNGFDIAHTVHQSQILQVILQLVVHRGLFPPMILRLHQTTILDLKNSIDLGDLGTVGFLHEMLAEHKLDLVVEVAVDVPADGVDAVVLADYQGGFLPDGFMNAYHVESCFCRVSMTAHG